MGSTLTHGVYLPDEGERNCYNGLAGNWQLLDNSVGTIAEHTTALAGKAPAVHTHTKSDITDFPAYGTTAGTICEGNDSRLSDARTPVAHTHTKSDVTDLLNSNFIPSANNSYDLGSSSYQWNNVYAKGYYYNGVAWGLDKANTWTGSNQFNVSVKFSGQTGINWARGGSTGTLPSSVLYYGFQNALDSNDNVFDRIRSYVSTTGTNLREHIKYAWNDLTKYATINYWINADGSDSEYKLSVKRVIPGSSNETDLGTATAKWKTLNGINPGALSLPDYSSSKVEPINFSQYSVSGGINNYTPDKDGWLCINIKDDAANSIFVYTKSGIPTVNQSYCASVYGNGSQGFMRLGLMMPVRAGITYGIVIKASSVNDIDLVRFFPALGNV